MPDQHAKLSPSSAVRWLTCPGSVRLTAEMFPEGVPQSESPWATEGTRAHTVAELTTRDRLGLWSSNAERAQQWSAIRAEVEAAPPIEGDFDDMVGHASGYADLIEEITRGQSRHLVMLENRVSPSVPGVWGTADCIIAIDDELYVIDYKYGKGHKVEAEDNPQLKLYALGAYNLVTEVLGQPIEAVHAIIYQPRISLEPEWATYDMSELLTWQSDYVVPQAAKATGGSGEIVPSDDACQWCPVAGVCRARRDQLAARYFGDPELLEPDEIAVELGRLKDIEVWCSKVREAGLHLAYERGVEIPGWKVVRARGQRRITDQAAAIDLLVQAGYEKDDVCRVSTETLGKLQKIVGGESELNAILGDTIIKPEGKETLVTEDDRRPAITRLSDAADEFSPIED